MPLRVMTNMSVPVHWMVQMPWRREGEAAMDGVEGVDVGAEKSIGFVVEDARDAGEVMSMDLSLWGQQIRLSSGRA
jgi:hypothetical protein